MGAKVNFLARAEIFLGAPIVATVLGTAAGTLLLGAGRAARKITARVRR